MSDERGRFITIEGAEGVGKSSNIEFIADRLARSGKSTLRTREPGGTPLAERIREILLDHREDRMTPESELLLMFAARVQHVQQVIEPALAAGTWVICDRFTDSSYAYQGAGRGVSDAVIAGLERAFLGDFAPDLTILLDVPVEVGMARAGRRGTRDRFEREELEFFRRVRDGFLRRAEAHPARIHVIATSADLAEVQRMIAKVLEETVLSN